MCGWQTAQFQFARSTYKDGEQQRERERERDREEKKGRSVAESARRRNATPDVTVRAPLQEYCRTVDGQRVSLRIVVCATLALRNLMCGWQTVQLEEADIKMGSSRERERIEEGKKRG